MDIAVLYLFVQCNDGEMPVLSVPNEKYSLQSQIYQNMQQIQQV